MTERRYTDEEVQAIFARATELQHAAPRNLPATQGLSLGQLQAVAREAGISEALVAEAARALDQPLPPPAPTFLGLPLGANHTVELGRQLSDAEWNQFVGELRTTFAAQGKLVHEGAFRSWRNGNLSVMLEPSGDGHRIRFQTKREEAVALAVVGAFLLGFAVVLTAAIALAAPHKLAKAMVIMPIFGLPGIGLLAGGILPLRGWARTRREQFQKLGARLLRGPNTP